MLVGYINIIVKVVAKMKQGLRQKLGRLSALGLLGFVSCWVNYHLAFDHGIHGPVTHEHGPRFHHQDHDHVHHAHGQRHAQLPKPGMQPSGSERSHHGSHCHELSSVKARHSQRDTKAAVALVKEPGLFTIFLSLPICLESGEAPPPKQGHNARPQPRGPPVLNLV